MYLNSDTNPPIQIKKNCRRLEWLTGGKERKIK